MLDLIKDQVEGMDIDKPAYLKTVGNLKEKYDSAVIAGDVEAANAIVRQMKMLKKDPNNFLVPRNMADELGRGFTKGHEGYYEGKKELFDMGDSKSYATPDESWVETAGNVLGSISANPFDPFKSKAGKIGYAAFEGLTAPAQDDSQHIVNALVGGGISGGLQAIGGVANTVFDLNATNPKLKDAVKFARKEGLPKPFIDDYTSNPMAKVGGWLVDNPLFVGSVRQSRRLNRLERWATDQAKKRKTRPRFVAESVSREKDNDIIASTKMYEDAFSWAGSDTLDSSTFRDSIDNIRQNLTRFGNFAPKKVAKEFKDLMTVGEGDIRHWHEVRSLLRETQDSMSVKMTKGRKYLNSAISELDQIIDDAMPEGIGKKLLKEADQFYSEQIPKYSKLSELVSAISDDDPEAVVRSLVGFGDKGTHRTQQLWNSLDGEGQEAIKGMVFRQATDHATDVDGIFNPAKYAQYWQKFSNRSGVMFNKKDQELINGAEKLYGLSKSLNESGSAWIQSRAISPMMGAGATQMFMPEEFLSVYGSGAVLAAMMRTQAGNTLLRNFGKAQNLAQQAGAAQKLSLMIARNPQLLSGTGVTPKEWDEAIKEFKPMMEKMYQITKDRAKYGVGAVKEWFQESVDRAKSNAEQRSPRTQM